MEGSQAVTRQPQCYRRPQASSPETLLVRAQAKGFTKAPKQPSAPVAWRSQKFLQLSCTPCLQRGDCLVSAAWTLLLILLSAAL